MTDTARILTDDEYAKALADLAEYERRIAESDRLAQRDSIRVAETLDRLYRDQRWVEERNAQRTATAKTPRGGRPVDPTSRSQFSTWVREHYNRIAPSTTYRLLDAQSITSSFLANGERTPTAESQVRPLKSLLSRANGEGARIPEVWEIACKLAADEGRDQPTSEDVKHAIAEWRRIHLPPAQAREERAEDRAWVKERQAVAAWKELLRVGGSDQINAFIDTIRADVEAYERSRAQA
jgi:hypothetical protein